MPIKVQKTGTDYTDHLTPSVEADMGEGSVTVTKKKGKEVVSENSQSEQMPAQMIPPDKLCRVSVGGGRKVNLGNYESADIHANLTLPCTREAIDDTFSYALQWVSEKIDKALKESAE